MLSKMNAYRVSTHKCKCIHNQEQNIFLWHLSKQMSLYRYYYKMMRVFKTNRDNLMFIFKVFSVVPWNLNCSVIKKRKNPHQRKWLHKRTAMTFKRHFKMLPVCNKHLPPLVFSQTYFCGDLQRNFTTPKRRKVWWKLGLG